jgi:hypothetical protein
MSVTTVAAEPAFGQTLGQGRDDAVPIWRVVSMLALCVLIAVAAAFMLRIRLRYGASLPTVLTRQRRMKLVEAIRLPNQAALCILACDDRELLVLTSAKGAELLERLPLPVTGNGPETDR